MYLRLSAIISSHESYQDFFAFFYRVYLDGSDSPVLLPGRCDFPCAGTVYRLGIRQPVPVFAHAVYRSPENPALRKNQAIDLLAPR